MYDEIFWNFNSIESKETGALPPIKTKLEFSSFKHDSIYHLESFIEKKRAIEKGYIVTPQDCPAIININNYGFLFKSPGNIKVTYKENYFTDKLFSNERTEHGHFIIEGDYWPRSDSDKILSWITGSKFFKIQTGIDVYFPINYSLYQGAIPFGEEYDKQGFNIWQGIEIFSKNRVIEINGKSYCICNINFIGTFKDGINSFEILKNDPIGIVYPVIPTRKIKLNQLIL